MMSILLRGLANWQTRLDAWTHRAFSETALGFYLQTDSIRTDYKTNVDFIISKDWKREKNGRYIDELFKVQNKQRN